MFPDIAKCLLGGQNHPWLGSNGLEDHSHSRQVPVLWKRLGQKYCWEPNQPEEGFLEMGCLRESLKG